MNLQEVYVEDEGGVGADVTGTTLAVSQVGRDHEGDLAAFAHELHAFRPAFDNAVEREGDAFVLVEFLTVDEGAAVVHFHGVAVAGGTNLAAGIGNEVNDTGGGGVCAVLGVELLAELVTFLLVQGAFVGGALLEVGVDDHVHVRRINLELLHEHGVHRLAFLGVEGVFHTLFYLGHVEVAEAVLGDDQTEVYAQQIGGGVNLTFGREQVTHFFGTLHLGRVAGHYQHGSGSNGGKKFCKFHITLFFSVVSFILKRLRLILQIYA